MQRGAQGLHGAASFREPVHEDVRHDDDEVPRTLLMRNSFIFCPNEVGAFRIGFLSDRGHRHCMSNELFSRSSLRLETYVWCVCA